MWNMLVKEILFYICFWMQANKKQRELLKNMITKDNPNYCFLKKYLKK